MTNEELKQLEDKLWDAANRLRASGGIKASDYAVPVLGIIFLRFADNRYREHEEEIETLYEQSKNSRARRNREDIAIAKCGFYLPPQSRYDHLLQLRDKESMAEALREAIKGIEQYQDESFRDLVPHEAYFAIEKKNNELLPGLVRAFSDIPQDASGDIFGKIYEYFLGKFALSEGQKGGEFFTPTSVVRFIVEVLEPYHGTIYDPACGSGGMFVQSASFLRKRQHNPQELYVYGQEHIGETARLAKMSLIVNSLRGDIREVNSYESDPFGSLGKFDFVMANPPFNVKTVKESTVKKDPRFTAYGLPKTKGKKDDRISDANYLWVNLFASSLNEQGRAGFVMANSASDARLTEYQIRKRLVDSGIVDCMVSMPANMFYTVTLPATIWFFDKSKQGTEREGKILFLDARNVYRQVDRAHRDWTEEQQLNLATVVRLYRGETERFTELIASYLHRAADMLAGAGQAHAALDSLVSNIAQALKPYAEANKAKAKPAKRKKLLETDFYEELARWQPAGVDEPKAMPTSEVISAPEDNEAQHAEAEELRKHASLHKARLKALKTDVERLTMLWKVADKYLKQKNDKAWKDSSLQAAHKSLDEALALYAARVEQIGYWYQSMHWLQKRFPDATYRDVTGLCKVAHPREYAEEQDYSLNPGRYVGVDMEGDDMTEEDFIDILKIKHQKFMMFSKMAMKQEEIIEDNIYSIIK
ncbi:N-6 DNA methylase [Roseivirga sp. BDSF3-8]|uniref:type I restriction-modification system subunit M n=1 Tax=Roseivirga sp. BDSF3-8 TaxID=3241598 RepID=UPI0035324CEF